MVGVDNNPDCRDGYLRSGAAEFICADVLEVMADRSFMSRFTFVHYSPPCQFASAMTSCRPGLRETYRNLITPGRPLLNRARLPDVIENVGAARPWLMNPVTLCMGAFGRETYRHRRIEAGGGAPWLAPACPAGLGLGTSLAGSRPARHPGETASAAGRILSRPSGRPRKPGYFVSVAGHERKEPVRRHGDERGLDADREAVSGRSRRTWPGISRNSWVTGGWLRRPS